MGDGLVRLHILGALADTQFREDGGGDFSRELEQGGASSGESDPKEAVKTAVINKRAGGTGLITGRKAFMRPMSEGIQLLNAVQDVYLMDEVTVA